MFEWVTIQQVGTIIGVCTAVALLLKILVLVASENIRLVAIAIPIGIIIALKSGMVAPPTSTVRVQEHSIITEEVKKPVTSDCSSINSVSMECDKDSKSINK
jgi:hypothetical protein